MWTKILRDADGLIVGKVETNEPLPRESPAAAPPGATGLAQYPVIIPFPELAKVFERCAEVGEECGLKLPHTIRLDWVDAPDNRPCDGETIRHADGQITVRLNVHAPDLIGVILHELA